MLVQNCGPSEPSPTVSGGKMWAARAVTGAGTSAVPASLSYEGHGDQISTRRDQVSGTCRGPKVESVIWSPCGQVECCYGGAWICTSGGSLVSAVGGEGVVVEEADTELSSCGCGCSVAFAAISSQCCWDRCSCGEGRALWCQ